MFRATLNALAAGGAGALAAWLVGFPAPFLTGPAATVSVAAAAGLRCLIPVPLRHLCFLLIGLGLGSGVTPDVLANAVKWPVSLIAMVLSVVAIMVFGTAMFVRWFGCDRRTAFLAATPGHLSFVLGIGLDARADIAFVSVVQSLRVLMLTLLVPAAVALATGAETTMARTAGPTLAPQHLLALAGVAAVVGSAFLWLRVPAAFLLAGMAVSVVGHGSGATEGALPQPLSIAAFVTMGTLIGTRFSNVTTAQLRAGAGAAFLLTSGGFVLVFLASLVVTALVDLPLVDVLIALAPGGLETMIAMSAVVGADPAYVGFHHVARLFLLSFLIPAGLSRMPLQAAPAPPPDRPL